MMTQRLNKINKDSNPDKMGRLQGVYHNANVPLVHAMMQMLSTGMQ